MKTKIHSTDKEVIISDNYPTVLIGERINPTGKSKLSAELQAGNFDIVLKEAASQIEVGADMLDVNSGVPDVDEVELMSQLIKVVMAAVNVPLCIDSKNHSALEAGLKVYNGKALVNSVTGEEQSLEEVLPLIKQYGAAVVGLTVDDDGIPKDAEERLHVARKIINRAESLNIPREDVIIDCLVMSVGADNNAGVVTLEAIRKIKAELGVNMTCGASNISFGVPNRPLLNNSFLPMAIAAGINCPILDVEKARPTVLAADLSLGRDPYAKRYSKFYRENQNK